MNPRLLHQVLRNKKPENVQYKKSNVVIIHYFQHFVTNIYGKKAKHDRTK
jgi:hypothetical protein